MQRHGAGRQDLPQVRLQGQELPGDGRVELGARRRAHAVQRFVQHQGTTVGAVGGHRVERVGHRDDAGAQRDVLGLQSVRIAGPVPALMVMADDRQDRL